MPESWKDFFSSDLFMPHGHCYLWQPALVGLQVVANGAIAIAYISIFATLVYLVKRIENIPFQRMYVAFAIFIVACGITHLFDIYVIWNPVYWLDGSLRAVTALASVATAILLPTLVPKAVALATASRLAQERGVQLEEANRHMTVLLNRTKELDQLKTQFFANVSHELRTPLTLILGPTERLLTADSMDAEQRRALELISRNAHTLLKRVNDLLDVSKLEAGKLTPLYTHVDVARLVRLVSSHFDGVAQEQSITYHLDSPPTLLADVDSEKLQRVLLNLLSNAFNFTPVGGCIRCSVCADGDRELRIEVADSGPGVRVPERHAIFDRFHQTETEGTLRARGTGLGLAIVRDFVLLHGGSIAVDDAVEGGALFTVTLPLSAPAGTAVAPGSISPSAVVTDNAQQVLSDLRTRSEPPLLGARSDGEQPLVLVVEDNHEMSRFICESLAPEYRVATAFNGRDGVAYAKTLKPNLILTDVMMPELAGDALVAQLRLDPTLDGVPIVLLTAKADDELRVKLLRNGAQDYLMKPFSVDELKARLGNLVAMKRVRDMLQASLSSQTSDLELLAGEVTERKRQLETALASVRVSREQAEQASKLKTNFLGLVSHELRTPVTAFQLQLERMRRVRDAMFSPQQQEIFQRLSASSARLAELVESLLHYTQIESGRLTTTIQSFDLRAMTREVMDELLPQADTKGLRMTLHAPDELDELHSDPQLVRLMLTNLVGNAVKFTDQGSVEVHIEHVAGEHQVTVTDTGPGIALEAQVRMFQPFEHMELTRQKHTPGIGLGLALVREMAAALGGRVTLESALGHGSTFVMALPSVGPTGR